MDTPMEYNSAIKKSEIFPFVATWMDLEDIMLVKKVRQRKKITYAGAGGGQDE